MSEADTAPPLSEEDFVLQSAFEAAYLPEEERHERRGMVDELIGELASQGALGIEEREKLLTLFDENIRIARGEDKQPAIPDLTLPSTDLGQPESPNKSKLPGLKQGIVEKTLKRAGCEIDTNGGKGSHVKVYNPETGKTTTLNSKHGNVYRGTLSSVLSQLEMPKDKFTDHL